MEVRIAKIEDIDTIRDLIKKRIDWMNQNDIRQWNLYDYLNIYTYEYFKNEIDNFYVATKNDIIVGAIGLFEEDEVWDDNTKALYIHNLVGDINEKGVGKLLMDYSEKIANEKNIHYLRLDCQVDNKVLNSYYETLGFKNVGTCTLGDYTGNKKEKELK